MASVGDESYDSMPSAQLVALALERKRLLQHSGPKADVQGTIEPQQPLDRTDEVHGNGPDVRPSITPDSLDAHRTVAIPSSSNKRPRFSSSNSAPAGDMETMVRSAQSPRGSKGIAKAASFTNGAGHYAHGGDTQPIDSQVYRRYTEMESMREEPESTTPQKEQSMSGTSPETMATDHDQTPQQTLQPGQMGYVDLDGMWQDRPASPATSPANYDELLVGDNAKSPDTQFYQPHRPNLPETPALAGQKHDRDGELLTSVTTATKYSQILPQGNLMGATQLFAQTQEHSSPYANGLPSDDAMTRPSPNADDTIANDVYSPRTDMSSPVVTRHVRSSSGVGEPRTEYTRMKESQEQREKRLRAQFETEAAANELESDSDDDTQQRRFKARQLRRTRSDQAMKEAARVSAPRRGTHLSSSARKPFVDLVTPATARRKVSFDDILEEAEEDEVEPDLPEGNDETVEGSQAEDDDQYDELQEKVIRSQSNFLVDEDDTASLVGSAQENGIEVLVDDGPLEDTQDPDDAEDADEDDDLQDPREAVHDTQRSTIADSQPLAQANGVQHTPTPLANHSSMASFIPGSQYIGKTSQDQAFLKASHPSQIRVAASQINETEKVPSSPPLPTAALAGLQHFTDSASDRQDAYKLPQTRQESTREDSATLQEVPESDVAERPVQEPRLDAPANGFVEEESNNPIPFSTAQTHVSASTRSPTKSYVAPSPLKAFRSQQNETPRKAFRDMIEGPKAMSGSFDFNDVDDIMAVVMTKEDEEVLAVISSPQAKRRKGNGSSPAEPSVQNRRAQSERSSHAPARNEDSTMSESNRTVQDYEPDFVQPALPVKAHIEQLPEGESLLESMATKETNGTIPESGPDLAQTVSTNTVLRAGQSKANVLPPPQQQEPRKARSSTPDSAEQREDAGSRHVAQLISTTRSSVFVSKKGKLKTPGNTARRKSDRPSKASKRAFKGSRRRVDTTDDDEEEDPDAEEAAEETELVDEINRSDTTPPPAERVHQAVTEPALPTVEDQPAGDEIAQDPIEATVVAPGRVWARFRGTPPNFYPATWLGGASDGMSYKIKFDDGTVTNIETWHVRTLDFRISDQVKVDRVGARNKNWRVVGFGAVVGDASAQGTDTHGHTHIRVQAASSRNSMPKGEAPADDAGETRDVLVSDLYLTFNMWKHYKNREFSPPTSMRAVTSRAGTPSSRLQTPDGETPSSRSRRNGPLIGNAKSKVGSSILRDSSVTSAASAASTALFSGMTFAITYISDDAEKAQVTRMIIRNGGVILEHGFGELFDIPNIVEPVASPSKKSPRKVAEDEMQESGLHLKSNYADYGFVALIADRHSRRAKYMQALALDLPTLSGRWITDSLNKGKNASLGNREMAPLPWAKYLLPAGESSYLGGAIRSRVMLPYDAMSSQLQITVQTRPRLLNNEGVLIVAPKKDKVAWERRRTYAFLTLALGAGRVERVNDLQDAKNMMQSDSEVWKWIYVDGKIDEAFAKICGKASGGKKRKRGNEAGSGDGPKMSVTDGNVTVVNDEFVVQSLILGALVD